MRAFRFPNRRQDGATAVEFALILMILVMLVFGILEFGRLFYVANTVQEVTRRAAREQVVRWVTATPQVRRMAVFGDGSSAASLPAGAEVADATVAISFHGTLADALANDNPIVITGSSDPLTNVNNCLLLNNQCIGYIRASLEDGGGQPIHYAPMLPLFDFLDLPLPGATVVMPAESLGLP